MTQVFKINNNNIHPRNCSMLVEKHSENEYIVHTYKRGVPASFVVNKEILEDVKLLLTNKSSSLDLLIHVLSDFNEQQKNVAQLFESALK